MPAARPPKRRASPSVASVDPPPPNHSFQLTFASPPSPPTDLPTVPATQGALSLQPTISFAPNVTPGTFTAPPPDDALLDGESPHNALFPDTSNTDGTSNPSKRRWKMTPASASRATPMPSKAAAKKSSKAIIHSKCSLPTPDSKSPVSANGTEAPAHIPRPPNAFILFRSSFIRSQHVSAKTEGNHGTLSKIVGMLWHALSYEERQVWQAKARRAYAEHKRMYPGYSFRPTKEKFVSHNPKPEREGTPGSSSDAPPKRKTRTVGPRDIERCEHIAALLARGLKGAELDAAMKEFDAARVPKTFTPRFEAPLTAQTYAAAKTKNAKEAEDVKREEHVGKASGPVTEPRKIQAQAEKQVQVVPNLAQVQPRRVRRSSSAPLLDAGLPISAPAPTYPTSSHAHFFNSQTEGGFEFGQQPRDTFTLTTQHGHDLHQTFVTPFGYSQPYPQPSTIQVALRKRSASSSPPLRRPSYSFSYPRVQPQLFGNHLSTSYPQQEGPQPFGHTYAAAHPHLQQIQAQVQEQARMQGQSQNHSAEADFGLEFSQDGRGPSYDSGGVLSRQTTMSDVSSENGCGSTTVNNSGFWNESVDFGNFSFSVTGGQESQTPVSAHPPNPNPFGAPPLSAVPSSAAVEEYTYTDMPGLVEAPMYQNYYQEPSRTMHHPQLEIQTSWTSQEFNFEQAPASAATVPPPSAFESDSVPPSAVSGAFDFPPSDGTMSDGYMDYSTPSQSGPVQVPTPCSPASQSVSGAPSSTGVRTPVDETFSAWDQSSAATTATACASPVDAYNACAAVSPEDESAAARAHMLALQAGFRAYLAHAEKTGALEKGASEATFEQFVRFVGEQQRLGIGVGGMKRTNVFNAEAQMANVNVM